VVTLVGFFDKIIIMENQNSKIATNNSIDRESSNYLLGIFIGAIYLTGIISSILYLAFSLFGDGADRLKLLISQMLTCIVMIVLYNQIFQFKLKTLFGEFKKVEPFIVIGKYLVITYGLTLLGSIVFQLIGNAFSYNNFSNTNEDAVNILINELPILTFFFVVLIAPIVEELIFRYCVFNYLKKHIKVAFNVSALAFVLIHLVSSIVFAPTNTLLPDLYVGLQLGSNFLGISFGALLTIPSYVIPSYLLTHIYHKNPNIVYPIILHGALNLVSFVLTRL
jgi:membrane protease YdiL (CAAX protease family)